MSLKLTYPTVLMSLAVIAYTVCANFKAKVRPSFGSYPEWKEYGTPKVFSVVQEKENSKTGLSRHPITGDFYYQTRTHLYGIYPRELFIDLAVSFGSLILIGVATELFVRHLRSPLPNRNNHADPSA